MTRVLVVSKKAFIDLGMEVVASEWAIADLAMDVAVIEWAIADLATGVAGIELAVIDLAMSAVEENGIKAFEKDFGRVDLSGPELRYLEASLLI
jgi:hypothetical protein